MITDYKRFKVVIQCDCVEILVTLSGNTNTKGIVSALTKSFGFCPSWESVNGNENSTNAFVFRLQNPESRERLQEAKRDLTESFLRLGHNVTFFWDIYNERALRFYRRKGTTDSQMAELGVYLYRQCGGFVLTDNHRMVGSDKKPIAMPSTIEELTRRFAEGGNVYIGNQKTHTSKGIRRNPDVNSHKLYLKRTDETEQIAYENQLIQFETCGHHPGALMSGLSFDYDGDLRDLFEFREISDDALAKAFSPPLAKRIAKIYTECSLNRFSRQKRCRNRRGHRSNTRANVRLNRIISDRIVQAADAWNAQKFDNFSTSIINQSLINVEQSPEVSINCINPNYLTNTLPTTSNHTPSISSSPSNTTASFSAGSVEDTTDEYSSSALHFSSTSTFLASASTPSFSSSPSGSPFTSEEIILFSKLKQLFPELTQTASTDFSFVEALTAYLSFSDAATASVDTFLPVLSTNSFLDFLSPTPSNEIHSFNRGANSIVPHAMISKSKLLKHFAAQAPPLFNSQPT